MVIPRTLAPLLKASRKGVLLLGPRQTGKSTLIGSLKPDLTINLAHEPTYLDFARNPSELDERLAGGNFATVFIDEVQRLPSLLNTIQAILDTRSTRPKFYLTGSSARKLKRGKANLLPGRTHTYHLGSLSCGELGYAIDTRQALETGTLPGIYTEPDPAERIKTLRSYASTYLKEEIQAEALTRNIEGFSRFLFVAANGAGRFLDLTKLASEAQIPRQSAARYFEMLEETLVIHRCEAFSGSDRQRLIRHPKFFFFDTGVLNALLGNFEASEDRKGLLFEHLFFNQLLNASWNADSDWRISTYRTEHGAEVDFIVETGKTVWAIELKASQQVGRSDLRGFSSFGESYRKPFRPVLAYLGKTEKAIGRIRILPWQQAIRLLEGRSA